MNNTLNFTAKTFTTIYADLKQKYRDKPDDFITMLSGLFDIMHWYLDARAQNLYLQTAFTEEAITDLTNLIGYFPNDVSPAGASLKIKFTANQLHQIPLADLIFTVFPQSGEPVQVEGLSDINFTGNEVTIPITEGITFRDVDLGSSNPASPFQEFLLPNISIVRNSVKIKINSIYWELIDNLVNTNGSGYKFMLIPKPNSNLSILFGDNSYGAIPQNFPILAEYRVSSGSLGNVKIEESSVVFSGAYSLIESCELVSDLRNGSDKDSITKTKFLAPKMIKVNERAIEAEDYEILSLKYSSSVVLARCYPGIYGQDSIGVFILAKGGGVANPVLLQNIQDKLILASPIKQRDVRVRSSVYTPVNISVEVKLRVGYSQVTYDPYIRFALDLITSEKVYELLIIFTTLTSSDVLSYLNTYMGYSFTPSDYSTLVLLLLKRLNDFRNLSLDSDEVKNIFGGKIFANNITGNIEYLPGVQYSKLLNPTPNTIIQNQFFRAFTNGVYTITYL